MSQYFHPAETQEIDGKETKVRHLWGPRKCPKLREIVEAEGSGGVKAVERLENGTDRIEVVRGETQRCAHCWEVSGYNAREAEMVAKKAERDALKAQREAEAALKAEAKAKAEAEATQPAPAPAKAEATEPAKATQPAPKPITRQKDKAAA